MVLSDEQLGKMVGEVVAVNIANDDLGTLPGGNVWGFNEGEEVTIAAANYTEAVAYYVNNVRVEKKEFDEEEKKTSKKKPTRKSNFKFFKLDSSKLLSLSTLMRRDRDGKFHKDTTVDMPSSLSIKEIIEHFDGMTLKVKAVGSFKTPVYGVDGKPSIDENGKPVMRDQKHYAWEEATAEV